MIQQTFAGVVVVVALAATLRTQCPTPWSAVGTGVDPSVHALARLPGGDVIAGGSFAAAGGVAAACIARWDGQNWSPLGTGMSGASGPPLATAVHCLAVLANGDLIAGGNFALAGGVPAAAIARWNGATWSAVGSTSVGWVRSIVQLPNGDLVAGGGFVTGAANPQHIARWDGSAWHALGSGVDSYEVRAMVVLPNGDLVAGGNFTLAGGVPVHHIARWNGSTWSPLGSGLSGGVFGTWVQSLCVLPDGDLIAGGNFTMAGGVSANRVARWNGSSWSALGSGIDTTSLQTQVYAVATLADGDLVVGGRFQRAGGVAVESLARWRSGGWMAMGAGMNGNVEALLGLAAGDLFAAGTFTTADGIAARGVARRTTSCAALATALGPGCAGTATPIALEVVRWPWLGGRFEARANGLRPASLAVGVFGFTPLAVPMAAVHPLGASGCTLWVDDDILVQFAVGNGRVDTTIAIPAAPALVGAVFHHQVVAVELDPGDQLIALTSSNALSLSIGAL
jgi:trimeric autotransporter adhesin